MYRKLAEERLSTRPQTTVEKEIVREEVRVVDEQTEERLRQALGDVARLKVSFASTCSHQLEQWLSGGD